MTCWFNSKKYKSQIKFAWELDLNEPVYKSASEIVRNSEFLVSIGYSFPNFNRRVDQFVLQNLNLEQIEAYVQDLNPKQIAQNLEWLGNNDFVSEKLNLKDQVNEFYIPPSFNMNEFVKSRLISTNSKSRQSKPSGFKIMRKGYDK